MKEVLDSNKILTEKVRKIDTLVIKMDEISKAIGAMDLNIQKTNAGIAIQPT